MRGRTLAGVVGLGAIAIGGALLGSELVSARKQGEPPASTTASPVATCAVSDEANFDYGSLVELSNQTLVDAALTSSTFSAPR